MKESQTCITRLRWSITAVKQDMNHNNYLCIHCILFSKTLLISRVGILRMIICADIAALASFLQIDYYAVNNYLAEATLGPTQVDADAVCTLPVGGEWPPCRGPNAQTRGALLVRYRIGLA